MAMPVPIDLLIETTVTPAPKNPTKTNYSNRQDDCRFGHSDETVHHRSNMKKMSAYAHQNLYPFHSALKTSSTNSVAWEKYKYHTS